MKHTVATQWVRADKLNSHLTKAYPAGQQQTLPAKPVMELRS